MLDIEVNEKERENITLLFADKRLRAIGILVNYIINTKNTFGVKHFAKYIFVHIVLLINNTFLATKELKSMMCVKYEYSCF